MKTSIYIMAHKEFDVPEMEGYIPLQVGAALHDDLGYLRDDGGDNISAKNLNFSELTGMYYVWKNDHDSDIAGLVHYRRYFIDNDGKSILTVQHIEEFLKKYDIIVPDRSVLDRSVKEQYVKIHHAGDLDAARAAVEKVRPSFLNAYDEAMALHYAYVCNMFIAPKRIFDAYCDFLFPVLFEAEKHIDISSYDNYQKRIYGFISERLLNVFILHEHLNVYEDNVAVTSEKAEIPEIYDDLNSLFEAGKFEEAEERIKFYYEKHPDVFFGDRLEKLTRQIHFRYTASKAEECEKAGDINGAIEWAKAALKFSDGEGN